MSNVLINPHKDYRGPSAYDMVMLYDGYLEDIEFRDYLGDNVCTLKNGCFVAVGDVEMPPVCLADVQAVAWDCIDGKPCILVDLLVKIEVIV